MPRLTAILLATLVAACGSRGPLVLPPGPPPTPILNHPILSPAKPTTPPADAADVNTDSKAETR
jgi:hypothetical protein